MTIDPDVLNNPIVTRRLSEGQIDTKVLSEEAINVFRWKPIRTAWGYDFGRPFYDRLPAWSQAYKKGYDRDQAYVYYDHRKNPRFFGPNTLQVTVDPDDHNFLQVEDGEITWYGGQTPVNPVIVKIGDLDNGLGLQNGRYQVGYKLSLQPFVSDSPVEGYSLIEVEEQSLANAAVYLKSTEETVYHEDYQAITDFKESWVPRKDFVVQDYYPGAQYFLDFRTPVRAERFYITGDQNFGGSSKLAVYYSDDKIHWKKADDAVGLSGRWEALIGVNSRHRYWQFLFWDGEVSIESISYSGEALYPDLRVTGPVPLAQFYISSLYDTPEDEYIILASFDVKSNAIVGIKDLRKSTPYKYEPVSEWLSSPSDTQLRCMFDDVQEYDTRYMSPVEGHYKFYHEMENFMCTNQGSLTLEGVLDSPQISFPETLELFDTSTNFRASIIEPPRIDILGEPIYSEDAANKKYTDYMLIESWSMDNGFY